MYEELIKGLKSSARWYEYGMPIVPSICLAAANAIEDLNRRIDRAIDLYNRNVEKSAMYEALAGISPEPPKGE